MAQAVHTVQAGGGVTTFYQKDATQNEMDVASIMQSDLCASVR
jgi:hypothetical protein